jgi:hypothetical protein
MLCILAFFQLSGTCVRGAKQGKTKQRHKCCAGMKAVHVPGPVVLVKRYAASRPLSQVKNFKDALINAILASSEVH